VTSAAATHSTRPPDDRVGQVLDPARGPWITVARRVQLLTRSGPGRRGTVRHDRIRPHSGIREEPAMAKKSRKKKARKHKKANHGKRPNS